MEWIFYIFIATIVVYIVGTPVLIADIGESYPDFCKRLGGNGVFFNPFKQLDLLWWIITRHYTADVGKRFHRYDLYLTNLVLVIIFGIATAIVG